MKLLPIELIYPVGCIFTTTDDKFDPNIAFEGTSWERLPEGRFLESSHSGGGN